MAKPLKTLFFTLVALLGGLFWTSHASLENASGAVRDKEVKVDLYDYGFTLSSPIDEQNVRFLFNNGGKNKHEVVLIRLAPGKTKEDYLKAGRSGTSTKDLGKPVKNIPPLNTGDEWTLSVKLRPGNYMLTCFVADEKTGKPHLLLGMHHEFSIL